MSILNNAAISIQLGIDDYRDDDPRRVISAIRNMYAGLLLMFKAKLADVSPAGSNEALMWSKILPEINEAGEVVLIGKVGQSVDVRDIQERSKALGIIGIQWKLLEDLQKIRNNVEHHYSDLPHSRLRQTMAGTFHLIQQFCLPHLGMHPTDFIGQDYWEFLTEEEAFFTKELKVCRENLAKVGWPLTVLEAAIEDMTCLKCESPLIKAADPSAEIYDLEFVCTKCGEHSGYEVFVEAALLKHFEWSHYVAMTDGGDPLLETCYSCGMEGWVVEAEQCAVCLTEPEHTECLRCSRSLTVDEYALHGLCGYCNHLSEKTMRE